MKKRREGGVEAERLRVGERAAREDAESRAEHPADQVDRPRAHHPLAVPLSHAPAPRPSAAGSQRRAGARVPAVTVALMAR